ncbi:hypothetical protein Taro_049631 [Colocasia esculenta]|uniref:NPH3 domain-containing protein n=1 Tax=Colocasia esculenta TaxID=4460 RepID=A0A843XBJ9_COLES|nr:hypothetical protein [Colocasia esculenta]
MIDGVADCNLLSQTKTFFDGLFYWTWQDVLKSLKSCEPFLDKISSLLGNISANSEIPLTTASHFASSSSSSSSPDASASPPPPRPPRASSPASAGSDPNLKVSKFLGVAESLPDFARDCFDGVYRALDIYLEAKFLYGNTFTQEER